MKAMIWKELRENLRWAALGCLVLAVAEFYMLSVQRRSFQDNNGNVTITNPNFLMVVLFGSLLVGGCLGALQILPERSRDRWAALLHRPVSRGVIFGGKAIAGLGLYGAAVTLPFLASACYAAWPGTFPAPFVAALLLPGLHALAGGAAFYAGSLLLCLHPGRWFGSRGIVLLAVGSVFLLQLDTDGPFLVLPLVSTSILLLAAWDAMRGSGLAAGRPRLGWIAFVAVVFLGAQGGLLLLDLGLGLLPGAAKVAELPATFFRFEVTQDGQVLKLSSRMDGAEMTVTDLEGRAITDERYVGNNSYQNFCQFWPLSYQLGMRRRGYFYTDGSGLLGINYVQRILLGNYAKENWYFLVGQNYFVGYDNLSSRCVGICDREGFKAPGARPVPFDDPLKGEHVLQGGPAWFWTGAELYNIAFLDRQTTPFFELAGGSMEAVTQIPTAGSYETYHFVVVGLENGFQVLDERGKPVFARPYLHDPRVWATVMVATNAPGDRFYVQSQNGFYSSAMEHPPTVEYLDELDLQGHVLHSYTQPVGTMAAVEPLWHEAALIGSLPIVPALLDKGYRQAFPASPMRETFAFERTIAAVSPGGWVALAAFAFVLAVIAFFWARRVGCTARTALGWAAFVFAFGPAGLLAFRLASHWPQRVRCPSCGHLRSLSRDQCAHCQQAWITPPPTGTEIFQPLTL